MPRRPQAIRRPASHPLHRMQRRRAWDTIRPWLQDFAAGLFMLAALVSWVGLLAMCSPRG